MNIICKWARLIDESIEDYDSVDETEGRIGISRPDELGKNINAIISKDIFDNREGDTKDLYDADFKCNISDTGALVYKFPEISRKMLPEDSSFIYFMCYHMKLNPERFVKYVNDKCSDILPEPIDINNVKYLGSFDTHQGKGRQDLFVVQNGEFVTMFGDNKIRQSINDSFARFRSKYQKTGLMIKFGTKEYLQRYLGKYPDILNKLDNEGKYIIMFAMKGMLKDYQQVKIIQHIDFDTEIFGDHEVKNEDIKNIGTISAKLRATGESYQLDVFAIKVIDE